MHFTHVEDSMLIEVWLCLESFTTFTALERSGARMNNTMNLQVTPSAETFSTDLTHIFIYTIKNSIHLVVNHFSHFLWKCIPSKRQIQCFTVDNSCSMFSIIKNIKPFTLSLLTNTISFERSNIIILTEIRHQVKSREYKKAEECKQFSSLPWRTAEENSQLEKPFKVKKIQLHQHDITACMLEAINTTFFLIISH